MKHLVITTTSDLSLGYFRPYADIHILDGPSVSVERQKAYSTVYVRSQFNKLETMPQNFSHEIDTIISRSTSDTTDIIDGMGGVDEILAFEDKWLQYQIFHTMMPATWLASDGTRVNDGSVLYKKRISSRARGIVWSEQEVMGDKKGWIVQSLLPIIEELRIYVIRGVVYPVGAVRQSKSATQKVKVVKTRMLTRKELEFADAVYAMAPQLDFIGLDVAVTDDGLRLIEVNRSPVFTAFSVKRE